MSCPSPGRFDDYAHGVLDDAARDALARHAGGCPACRLYLAEAVQRALGQPTVPSERPRRAQFLTGARTARVRPAGLLDGRYELLEQLSQGGMGRVFRGRHRDLGRAVAVKLVLEGWQDNARMRELFFAEARTASAMKHPNVATVIDFGADPELGFFLVMDLLEGETLRQRMRQRFPDSREAGEILAQVIEAVRYVHGRGVVHCDLKPENIFLSGARVTLIDFGVSFRVDSVDDAEPAGTAPYRAPEQRGGQPPSTACDIYALGVLIGELLRGDRDPRLEALLSRATDRDPARRQPTVEELGRELVVCLAARAPRPPARSSLSSEMKKSPLPIAIFEPAGALRFGNRAFLERAAGHGAGTVARFDELRIARRDLTLCDAFAEVASSGRAASWPVATVGGGAPGTLMLVPVAERGRVRSIHATWIDGVLSTR